MKQVNIKQPKYILPAIALPFILLIGYIILDMSNSKKVKAEKQLVQKNEINTEIPEANLTKKGTKSKFEALKETFKKSSDFSSIQGIEKEEETMIEDVNTSSLYTTDEMRLIDSLNQASRLREEEMKQQRMSYDANQFRPNVNGERPIPREAPNKSKELDDMELFKMQMAYLDSLQNPEKYSSPNEELVQEEQEKEPASQVLKAGNPAANYFNTVGVQKKTSLITAILDENIKVKKGSRVRIRLLDDIMIDDAILIKGSYLYGNVSGFDAQRVKISISSIMIEGHRMKVDLSVFDNDGQEGFYVPASSFRDLSKDLGGQLGSQQIQMDQQQNNMQQLAYGALQDVYSSTTRALSKNIKHNKAKLKYNTQVFLVNNKVKDN